MRLLLIIVGVLAALVLQAAPDAYDMPGAQAYDVAADDASSASHCDHAPCPDATHVHVTCAHAASAYVSVQPIGLTNLVRAFARVPFMNDGAAGRTLLPPVPPPLA